jgi:hypothetical protein
MGELPSGQKLVALRAANADGVRFYTSEDSIVRPESLIPNWISVEDRLPEFRKYKLSPVVLTWTPGRGRRFALLYDNGQGKRWFSDGEDAQDITHWMPLPEPPKEET